MAILVVEFSRKEYKIRKAKKTNCSQMKLLNLEDWSCGELSKRAKTFKVNFLCEKSSESL